MRLPWTLVLPSLLAVGISACGGSGADTGTPVQPPVVPPVVTPGRSPDVVLLACDAGLPLWVAAQEPKGEWTTVPVNEKGRYEISWAAGKGGLIVVDTSGGAIRTNVLYMAADEFSAVIQRTDTLRTCTRRSANVTVAGLRGTDIARVGLGSGLRTISDNGIATPITDLGVRTVSLGAARAHFITQRADMLILRRDIPFPGPHAVLDFGSSEAIRLDSVPITVTNTRGQITGIGMSLLSASAGGASVDLDRLALTNDGTVQVIRVPVAAQSGSDVHALLAQTSAPDPRQVIAYTRATAPGTLVLGPPLNTPTVSLLDTLRPRMQLAAQPAYATAVTATWFQSQLRLVNVTVSARYLGGTPTTWDISPPDLTGVPGWKPAWRLLPGQADWQASAYGGLMGSEAGAHTAGRTTTAALRQGSIIVQ